MGRLLDASICEMSQAKPRFLDFAGRPSAGAGGKNIGPLRSE
jgi:hypothetical protein